MTQTTQTLSRSLSLAGLFGLVLAACSSEAPAEPATWLHADALECQGEGIHPASCTTSPPSNPTGNPTAASCAKFDPECSLSQVTWAEAAPFNFNTKAPDTAFTDALQAAGCGAPALYSPTGGVNSNAGFIAKCPNRAVGIVSGGGNKAVSITQYCDRCTGTAAPDWSIVEWSLDECTATTAIRCKSPSGCNNRGCLPY